MKTLQEFAQEVQRDVSAVRRKADKLGLVKRWAISPASGQRVRVLSPADEKLLRGAYPSKLKELP